MSKQFIGSLSSTPFTSAPCSPGRNSTDNANPNSAAAVSAFFFSAPASPTHFLLSSAPAMSVVKYSGGGVDLGDTNFEFGLSARGAMSTADKLFENGQIRSGFASPERDFDEMERNGSVHRRARSVSPTRSPRLNWRERRNQGPKPDSKSKSKSDQTEQDRSVSTSSSTSRSSSSSSTSSNPTRNSKRWAFIKDLFLHRSKSEGSQNRNRNRPTTTTTESRNPRSRNFKNTNKADINGSLSPVLYRERAVPSGQTEEMRRRTTFLPYRPGLLFGCLGFRRYGAIDGFARNISSVSSSR